jgi:class 3 adenylate cyclase
MLEGAGYRVTLVPDCRAAVQSVTATRPDLVILEAVSAASDALEACRRLRADERSAYLPIIALTGPGARRMRLLALESGADEAVPLPLDREELLLRIHNLLLQDSRRASAVQHERRLNMLMTLAAQLHVHLELSHIVATLYRALQEQMGFRKVVLLLLDPSGQTLRPAAMGGDGPPASGTLYAWRDYQHLLDRRYQVSRSYFVSRVTKASDPMPSGPWQPGETLLVPLRLPEGRTLGLISLDAPRDGQRPRLQQIYLIEQFAEHTAIAVHNTQSHLEQQRRLSAYVSAPVAAQLAARGAPPPQPIESQVTVLFSDLRDFTPLSERLTPAQLVNQVLNPYFHYMSEVIHQYGGVVDKFLGDGIMAVFGLPLWQGDEAAKALLAALAMQNTFGGLQEQWRHSLGWEIGMGIGVAYGRAVVGTVGSAHRLDYTAIGPVVNTASRVASRVPAGQVWATGDVVTLADNYIYSDRRRHERYPLAFRPLMPTLLKGMSDFKALFECFLAQ